MNKPTRAVILLNSLANLCMRKAIDRVFSTGRVSMSVLDSWSATYLHTETGNLIELRFSFTLLGTLLYPSSDALPLSSCIGELLMIRWLFIFCHLLAGLQFI